MTISSSAFENNQMIPQKYTCEGQNINPPLVFSEVPDNAQSLVLICDDPDAMVGTWTHWLIINIEPKTTQIAENNIPSGSVLGKTSSGGNDYHGPCPPSGTHRYFFKLFALDIKLDLPEGSDVKTVKNAINEHVIQEAELIGLYERGSK